MKLLVTGAAGFIGFHTAKALLDRGDTVIGVDNLNDYYDVSLKQARLTQLEGRNGFGFIKSDLADRAAIKELFETEKFDRVVHLAAQAGVRYSIENPHAYVDSNLVGFTNILEGCRNNSVEHLVFASSSSVYGANTSMPFSVHQNVDHPLSLYAATKKSNELMAHAYANLYQIPVTGLRFFTVYGPWGRPDMAPIRFAKAIYADEPIDIYNHGKMKRDFTYVEDLVEGILRLIEAVPVRPASEDDIEEGDSLSAVAPFRQVNIGNADPVPLMDFIAAMEAAIGVEAKKNFMDIQPGDVPATWADITLLKRLTGYAPKTDVMAGAAKFVDWYKEHYNQG